MFTDYPIFLINMGKIYRTKKNIIKFIYNEKIKCIFFKPPFNLQEFKNNNYDTKRKSNISL